MTKIIITDVIDTEDDFIEIDMKEKSFWRVFDILADLFKKELPTDKFNQFTGVAHAMDMLDITDIPTGVFNKAFELLDHENNPDFVELIDKMQADPRFEIEHA